MGQTESKLNGAFMGPNFTPGELHRALGDRRIDLMIVADLS